MRLLVPLATHTALALSAQILVYKGRRTHPETVTAQSVRAGMRKYKQKR